MLELGVGLNGPRLSGRRGGAGFNPASLGGLAAHYDTGTGLFQDSGGAVAAAAGAPVGRVSDLSGNGRHLTQAASASRPVLRQVADRRSIHFSGSQWLDIPGSLQLDKQNSSIVAVVRTRSSDTQALWHMPAGSTGHAFYFNNGIGAGELRFFSDGSRNPSIGSSHGIATVAAINGAQETKLRLGGEASSGLAASPVGTVAGGWVGQWNGGAFQLTGHVYEILVYSRALTDAELERLIDHLQRKHGAQARDETCFIAFEGDSITEGIGASAMEDFSYPAQLARRCASSPKWVNLGSGGDTIQNMAASTGAVTGMLAKNLHYANRLALLLAGTNDINNSRSEAQVKGDIDAWIAAIRSADAGATPCGCTILPRTDFNAAEEAARLAVNAHTWFEIGEEAVEAFEDVRFPISIGREASVEPAFSTAIVATANGFEQRNGDWADARLRFDAGPGVRGEAELRELIAFFRARRGAAVAFRFTDPFDHEAEDQLLGVGDGHRTEFPLVKRYGDQERRITRPVTGSVRTFVAGVERSSGWVLDPKGVVRLETAPAAGADVRASFSFDVPVRFAEDRLTFSRATFAAGEIASVPLIEVREL